MEEGMKRPINRTLPATILTINENMLPVKFDISVSKKELEICKFYILDFVHSLIH